MTDVEITGDNPFCFGQYKLNHLERDTIACRNCGVSRRCRRIYEKERNKFLNAEDEIDEIVRLKTKVRLLKKTMMDMKSRFEELEKSVKNME